MTELISENFWTCLWTLMIFLFGIFFPLNYKVLSSQAEKKESFDIAIEWLKQDKFGMFYRRLLGCLLDKVSHWIGDKAQPEKGCLLSSYNRFFSVNPFTHQSYEAMLRLAFIYPMLLFCMAWAMGDDGLIARGTWQDGAKIPLEKRWELLMLGLIVPIIYFLRIKQPYKKLLDRNIIILVVITIMIVFTQSTVIFIGVFLTVFLPCYGMGWVTAWMILHDKTSAHRNIFVFALSISINIAFVSALLKTTTTSFDTTIITTATLITTGAVIFFSIVGSVAGTIASIAGGIISAIFVDVFLKDSFGIVGAIGVSVSGFIFVLLNMVHKQSEKQQCMLLFWLSYSLIFLTIAFIIIDIGNFNSRFLLLFLLIFPLLNAPVDWLSLNITRGLLQSIRHQHHGGWQAFSWALFDLILALIFLLMVSAILVLAMGYADWLTGDSYLPKILSEISRSDTPKNYYWIYLMLLTTLVPTLVHSI